MNVMHRRRQNDSIVVSELISKVKIAIVLNLDRFSIQKHRFSLDIETARSFVPVTWKFTILMFPIPSFIFPFPFIVHEGSRFY